MSDKKIHFVSSDNKAAKEAKDNLVEKYKELWELRMVPISNNQLAIFIGIYFSTLIYTFYFWREISFSIF